MVQLPQIIWFVSLLAALTYIGLLIWEIRAEPADYEEILNICFWILSMVLAPTATSSADVWWSILTYLPVRAASLLL